MLRKWEDYQNRSGKLGWKRWLSVYIANMGNPPRGKGYENLTLFDVLGLSSEDPPEGAADKRRYGWRFQATIPGNPNRIYEAVNDDLKLVLECKSGQGNQTSDKQLTQDARNLADTDYKIAYLLGARPTAGTKKRIAAVDRGAGGAGRISYFYLPAEAILDTAPAAEGPGAEVFTPPGQEPASGALSDAIAESPATREEAQAVAEAVELLAEDAPDPAEFGTEAPGGIDFSTLELRYVADPEEGDAGVQYAFRADPSGDELSWGGLEAVQQASDAFFVWLALPADTFWVNLNPSEPDRIVDADFGTTDAGRILLEADLRMKKTVAELIHPDTKLGARFWDAQQADSSGHNCLSFRKWIVPKPAVVRETDDELYILDAPLEVKLEAEYLEDTETELPRETCPQSDPAAQQHNEEVFRSLILPEVEQAVNTAPEYAELRRVYLARVAAEWYRERSEHGLTAFDDIVDSGDVSPWPARTDWSPREVFDDYVKSFTEGEFNVTREVQQGNVITTTTYVYGGVDFESVPRDGVDENAFQDQWPTLPDTVDTARDAPAEADDHIWLGGEAADRYQPGLLPPMPPLPVLVFMALAGLCLLTVVGGVIGVVLYANRRRPTPVTGPHYPARPRP